MSISAFLLLLIVTALVSGHFAPRFCNAVTDFNRSILGEIAAQPSSVLRALVKMARGILIGLVAIIVAGCASLWALVLAVSAASLTHYADLSVWLVALYSATALLGLANIVMGPILCLTGRGKAKGATRLVIAMAVILGGALPLLICGGDGLLQLGAA